MYIYLDESPILWRDKVAKRVSYESKVEGSDIYYRVRVELTPYVGSSVSMGWTARATVTVNGTSTARTKIWDYTNKTLTYCEWESDYIKVDDVSAITIKVVLDRVVDNTRKNTTYNYNLSYLETTSVSGMLVGTSISYKIEESSLGNTLTLSGDGNIVSYAPVSEDVPLYPWSDYRQSINSIIINDGIDTIGDEAFKGFSSATSLYISDTCISIGKSAFEGCSSLKEAVIPNSVSRILENAFLGCSSLTSAYIPEGVDYIGSKAFSVSIDCIIKCGKSAKGVNWESDWDAGHGSGVAKKSFLCTQQYTGTIRPENKVELFTSTSTIAELRGAGIDHAFVSRASTDNPSTSDDEYAILYNQNMAVSGATWHLVQEDSTTKTGHYALYLYGGNFATQGSTYYTVMYTENVVADNIYWNYSREEYDFYESLTGDEHAVVIPDTCTTIHRKEFQNFPNLSAVYIPSSVSTIEASTTDDAPFNTGGNNIALVCEAGSVSGSNWNYNSWVGTSVSRIATASDNDNRAILLVDGATDIAGDLYINNAKKKRGTDYVVEDGKLKFNGTFNVSKGDLVVYTPSGSSNLSVFNIGYNRFEELLSSINLADSTDRICFNTFIACTNTAQIELPDYIHKIPDNAFKGFSLLSSIKTEGYDELRDISSIGSHAFEGCAFSSLPTVKKTEDESTSSTDIVVPTSYASPSCTTYSDSSYHRDIYRAFNEQKYQGILSRGQGRDMVWKLVNTGGELRSIQLSFKVRSRTKNAIHNPYVILSAYSATSSEEDPTTNPGKEPFYTASIMTEINHSKISDYSTKTYLISHTIPYSGSRPDVIYIKFESSETNYIEITPSTAASLSVETPAQFSTRGGSAEAYSLESVGEYAFANCMNLSYTELDLSSEALGYNKLSEIPEGFLSRDFVGSTAIRSIKIGENVSTIGASAFKNVGLEGMFYIPASVTTVGSRSADTSPFSGNVGIDSIYYGGDPDANKFDSWDRYVPYFYNDGDFQVLV